MPDLLTLDGVDVRTGAMGVTTRTGRYEMPETRGENLELPGRSGYVFNPNKPLGPGQGFLSCWAIGALASKTVYERNLLLNPAFEVDVLNWNKSTSLTTARSAAWAYSGTYSMELNVNATGQSTWVIPTSDGAVGKTPLVVGEWIACSVQVKAIKACRINTAISFTDAAGAVLGQVGGGFVDFAAGEVKSVDIVPTQATIANTAFAYVQFLLQTPAGANPDSTGIWAYFDAARQETWTNAKKPSWFTRLPPGSGMTPGWTWDGTPHASKSSRYDYDISIPPTHEQKRKLLEDNVASIQRLLTRKHKLATIRADHPDGIRRAFVEFTEMSGVELQAGGTRAEFQVAYEIPAVFWEDEAATVQAATVGSTLPKTLDLTSFAGMTGFIEDAVITVSGAITNPRVTDSETGAYIEYTGTVPNGQSWVIDVGAFTSKVNNASVMATTKHVGGYRLLTIPNVYLATNTPRLVLSGSAGGAATNLSVSARRKWVSG